MATSVSACIIVKNESSNLAACITPWRALVDEIVVVDTGSDDGTPELARELGARVSHFPWCDDFSAARNEALRHATGEWVFWLDADDRIDDENVRRLQAAFAMTPKEHDGYLMHCVCEFAGGDTVSLPQVRLFRNDERFRWERRVHEQIAPSIARANGTIGSSNIVIRHVGYADHAAYRSKIERNLALLARESAPGDIGEISYLRGSMLLELGRTAEAMSALEIAAASPPEDEGAARMLYVRLAEGYVRKGEMDKANAAVCIGLRLFPCDANLLWASAQLSAAAGHYDECARVVARLARDGGDVAIFAPVDDGMQIRAFTLMCRIYLHVGRAREAERLARWLLDRDPSLGPAWLVLGESLLAQNNRPAFDAVRGALGTRRGERIAHVVLGSLSCLHDGKPEEAGAMLDAALQAHPDEPSIACARARVSMAMGQHDDLRGRLLNVVFRAAPLDVDAWALARASEAHINERAAAVST